MRRLRRLDVEVRVGDRGVGVGSSWSRVRGLDLGGLRLGQVLGLRGDGRLGLDLDLWLRGPLSVGLRLELEVR